MEEDSEGVEVVGKDREGTEIKGEEGEEHWKIFEIDNVKQIQSNLQDLDYYKRGPNKNQKKQSII
jgi:hypothetical protein